MWHIYIYELCRHTFEGQNTLNRNTEIWTTYEQIRLRFQPLLPSSWNFPLVHFLNMLTMHLKVLFQHASQLLLLLQFSLLPDLTKKWHFLIFRMFFEFGDSDCLLTLLRSLSTLSVEVVAKRFKHTLGWVFNNIHLSPITGFCCFVVGYFFFFLVGGLPLEELLSSPSLKLKTKFSHFVAFISHL